MPAPAVAAGAVIIGQGARMAARAAAPHIARAGKWAGRKAVEGGKKASKWIKDKYKKWRKRKDDKCETCCKVGNYSSLKCPANYQRHHIVPEYALKNPATKQRISGMPSQGKGAAICLKGHATVPGTEHNKAQVLTRTLLGAGAREDGTASLGAAKKAGLAGLAAAGKDPKCIAKATLKVEQAFGHLDNDTRVTANY